MYIGYNSNTGLFYEGSFPSSAHGIYPHPVITPASLSLEIENPTKHLPQSQIVSEQKTIFREDFFDPVTKIRRGRFYSNENQQEWHSSPHQAGENMPIQKLGGVVLKLTTFSSINVSSVLTEFPKKQYSIALGSAKTPTLWTVIGIEMSTTGEEIVLLKSRTTIGSLPELMQSNLPPSDIHVINQAFERLSSDLYRSGPESIIDHCRDLAEHILRAKIRTKNSEYKGKELNELVSDFKNQFEREYRNIPNCAEIIRTHHQRRKTAIQDTTSVRPLMVQDAELCVYCTGSILADLGWARWI
jgi:hypothetical protein